MSENTAIAALELAMPFAASDEHTDLVIRTSDQNYLYVAKFFLSFASSFFRDLFAHAISTKMHQDLPIVDVEEDRSTFRTILLLCYPDTAPKIDFDTLASVMRGLDKYCMDRAHARLQSSLVTYFQNYPASSSILLRVYGLARRFGYRQLYLKIASLSISEDLGLAQPHSDLDSMTGSDYHALQLYRQRVYHAVRSIVQVKEISGTLTSRLHIRLAMDESTSLIRRLLLFSTLTSSLSTCGKCGADLVQVNLNADERYVHGWLEDYLDNIITSQVPRPPLESLKAAAIAIALKCQRMEFDTVQSVLRLLDDQIEEAVSKVDLESMM